MNKEVLRYETPDHLDSDRIDGADYLKSRRPSSPAGCAPRPPAGKVSSRTRASCAATIAVLILFWSMNAIAALADGPPIVPAPEGIASSPLQVLEDKSLELTIDDVLKIKQRFTDVMETNPNYGYSHSAFWARVSVQNRTDERRQLYVNTEHTLLDHASLFVIGERGRQQTVRTGDMIPFRDRPVPSTTMVLPFSLEAGESAELYIRLQAEASVMLIPISIHDEKGLLDILIMQRLIRGALLGLFLALFFYNLFILLLLRERTYLYYVVYLFFTYLSMSSLDGTGAAILFPNRTWPANEGLVFFGGISYALILLFIREFLGTKSLRRLDLFLQTMIIASVLLTLSPFFAPLQLSYKLLSLMTFAFPIVALIAGLITLRRGKREARFYMIGQAASWVGLLVFSLVTAGILPHHRMHMDSISLSIAVDALLLSLALADRIRILQTAKLDAEDRARHYLESRKEELERQVEERTRELLNQIEERERTERVSREARQFTDAIISNISEGICVLDLNMRYVLWNKALERLTHIPAKEALGKTMYEVFPELKDQGRQENHRRVLAGESFTSPDYYINARGLEIWWSNSYAPQRNDKGEIIGIITLTHDITARKKAEQELQSYAAELAKSNQELDERGKALARAIEAADAATRAKSEFLANMSHEIRTPLNGVLGMTDLALGTDLDDEQREYLSIVKSSANSLLSLLNDILDFSKIEAGKLEIDATSFGLRETLGSALKTLSVRAHEKNLELICDIADDVPEALIGDPTRLRQIVLNLAGNAIKFTHQGEITVSVRIADCGLRIADFQSPGKQDLGVISTGGNTGATESNNPQSAIRNPQSHPVSLHFTVADTGIGIPADRIDKIFGAFEQVDASTTRKYGGTGLGLAITRQLVELMGGELQVESQEGRGSRFHFTLPLEIETAHDEDAVPQADLTGRRVLIVDDNDNSRRVIAGLLKLRGAEIVEAASGARAVPALTEASSAQRPFDLALLDWQMPEMNGLQTAEAIRAIPAIAETPLLLLALATHIGTTEQFHRLGIAARLTKPILAEDLLRAVRKTLDLSVESAMPEALDSFIVLSAGDYPLRILLVDDNAVNRQLGKRILEKRGHTVILGEDGRHGLKLYREDRFDLILMDVQMPEMNGFEATGEIRRLETELGYRTPIIAMTAMAMKGDREACLAAGMDEYITKPLRTEELIEKIQSLLAGIADDFSIASPGRQRLLESAEA